MINLKLDFRSHPDDRCLGNQFLLVFSAELTGRWMQAASGAARRANVAQASTVAAVCAAANLNVPRKHSVDIVESCWWNASVAYGS